MSGGLGVIVGSSDVSWAGVIFGGGVSWVVSRVEFFRQGWMILLLRWVVDLQSDKKTRVKKLKGWLEKERRRERKRGVFMQNGIKLRIKARQRLCVVKSVTCTCESGCV